MASEPSVFGHSTDKSFSGDIRGSVLPVSAALIILTAIALAGYFTHEVTHDLQIREFENKYDYLASDALVLLRKGLDDSIRGIRAVSAVLGSTFPTADQWPFVYLYDYQTATVALNRGLLVNFAPMVKPEEAEEFETFAYHAFNATYPNPVAQSSFGEGIFAPVNYSCFECSRYHDISGNTTYGSPNQVLVPILQGNASVLMFNVHSSPLRGRTVDAVISCTHNATTVADMNACGAISPPTFRFVDSRFLTSILYFPVSPIRNSTTLTGLTMVGIRWTELLETLFPASVSQMYCVLRADDQVYTFVIEHGVVVEMVKNDIHQEDMNMYAKVASITSRISLQSAITTYTLTIYPTKRFRRDYINEGPLFVAIIVVVVLFTLFIAAACGLYFYQLRRRTTKSTTVSKAKRLFIRYISHEIRTPLNTVSLGLSLLLYEMSSATAGHHADSNNSSSSSSLTVHNNSHTTTINLHPTTSNSNEWCKLVAELIENSQCAVMLLDDLLSFEQFEQGTLQSHPQQEGIERQVLPVWELLRTVIASFSVRARLSDVRLLTEMTIDAENETEGGGVTAERRAVLDALRVLGNEAQLKRVIVSLLGNALQFSHEGGQITISCSWIERPSAVETSSKHVQPPDSPLTLNNLYQEGRTNNNNQSGPTKGNSANSSSWDGSRSGLSRAGTVRVAVTDQGAGMTAEQTAQVFGKGKRFSLSALQAGQGSGLGLFVCKIIAEQHHATIRVTSPGLGLGSTYTLDLPVFSAPVQAQAPRGQLIQEQEYVREQEECGSMRLSGSLQLQEEKQPISTVPSPTCSFGGAAAITRHVEEKKSEEIKDGELKESEEEKRPDGVVTQTESAVHGAVAATAGPSPSARPDYTAAVSFSPAITIPTTTPTIPDAGLFSHKRILVVDDAPSNRKMLVRVLAKQGHVCEQAHDGQMAVDMVQTAEKNNSAYDMILMDYEMPVMNGPTATAKLRELGFTLPIVGVTGNVLPADVEYFLAQGADAVLPKPLQLAALEAVWKRRVEEEQQRRQDGIME